MRNIIEYEKSFAAETKALYGKSDAYKQSQKKYSKYSKAEKLAIFAKSNQIFQEIAVNMNLHHTDPKIQGLVAKWQQHISDSFYTCTDEILAGLGEIYVTDNRFRVNIDQTKKGLAEYISKAIKIFVEKDKIIRN